MEPWEIMISESQERMVAAVRPQMLDAVREVCARWELPCTVIGEVAEGGVLHALHDGETRRRDPRAAAHRRVPALRGRAAAANRRGAATRREQKFDLEAPRLRAVRPARRLANGAPPGARRRGAPAAPVACAGSPCRFRAARRTLDPFHAGASAVFGAARNVACAGGEPIGLTDCLNFGNPGEAGDRVGARAGDRRHRRRRDGARHARRVGQRLALQRDRRPRDPADARRRLRRPRARRAADSRPLAAPATSCCSRACRRARSSRARRRR